MKLPLDEIEGLRKVIKQINLTEHSKVINAADNLKAFKSARI